MVFISLFVVFYSCDKQSENLKPDSFELSDKVAVLHSTNFITPEFLNMGVTELTVSKNDNLINYKAVSQKDFRLNYNNVRMSDFEVVLEGEFLSLRNFPEYKISLSSNEPYFITPIFEGPIEKLEMQIKDEKISILLLFLREITIDNSVKINSISTLKQSKGCGFWNTYYVYATGSSRSVAEADLTSEISDYSNDLEGRTKYGGTDTSCLWENHACVSSQAYCCN